MNENQRNQLYALIVLVVLFVILAFAYSLRNTSLSKFPHQVDKVRPGGVLPQRR